MIALLLLACTPARDIPAGPPNILLISLDTVRADRLSPYGYARDTTPALAALAAEGTTFLAAFSQGNESAYSHAAMFTGRYASELARPDYATYGVPLSATFVSEALQAYGYRTGMFSAGGHVTADFGFDQGWDHFSAESGFSSLWQTGPRAVEWITEADTRPWFAFVHAYDAHRPYTRTGPWDHLFGGGAGSLLAETIVRSPCISEMVLRDTLYLDALPTWFAHPGGSKILDPASYGRLEAASEGGRGVRVTAADRAHINDHYDGGLLYADVQLGITLDKLRTAGKLDNTVVLVVSDHGEDLLDHGYMNHRVGLYDSTTRVPTIAWGPGFAAGDRVEGLVDTRDVAGTVLALAGARPPVGSGGRDLRAVARGEIQVDAVFSEGVMNMVAVRTATHRLVFEGTPLDADDFLQTLAASPVEGDAFLLYDLDADPGETRDIHRDDPGTTAALRDRLVEWRRANPIATYALDPAKVSPAVADELRRHGYWGQEDAPDGEAKAEAPQGSAANATFIYESCQDRFQFTAEATPGHAVAPGNPAPGTPAPGNPNPAPRAAP